MQNLEKISPEMDFSLRVSVDSGGCSGFQYVFKIDKSKPNEDDRVFERDGAKVVVDTASMEMIKGATVDFTQVTLNSSLIISLISDYIFFLCLL